MRGIKVSENDKQTIYSLRMQGKSINEISKIIKISKSTVFQYIKVVDVLPEFKKKWLNNRIFGSRKIKIQKEENALNEAQNLLQDVSEKEFILFLAALYWADGSKKDFGLSNTDPNLIKVYVAGLRKIFGITNDRLRISIRIYEGLDKDACLQFWSKIVNIPKDKFVNINVLQGKKVGKLPYGMCRVRVSKGELFLKKFKAICVTFAEKMSL